MEKTEDFRDLEKNETTVSKKARKANASDLLAFVVAVLLIGAVFNFWVAFDASSVSIKTQQSPAEGIVHALKKIVGSSGPDVSEFAVSPLIDSGNLRDNDAEEWDKYVNEVHRNNQKPPVRTTRQPANLRIIDAQLDLKEILSVASIILLNDDDLTPEQEEATKILNSVKFAPEMKQVNLSRHPRCEEIVKYLKRFSAKKESFETYNDYRKTMTNPHSQRPTPAIANEKDNDMPRLFISGLPVADYNDIITKHRNNELHSFLNEVGEGKIKIAIN